MSETTMKRHNPKPVVDYMLRAVSCAMLFGAGFALVSTSTFAQRMRDDVPSFLPGMDGPTGIALVLSALLALVPLVAGRAFLGTFLVSCFLLAGIGGYWWTTIPWDEFITESNFPATERPGILDFAFVASPVVIAAFYVAGSRASRLRADYLKRGVEREEANKAAAAGYLSGVAAFVLATGLAAAMWWVLADGSFMALAHAFPRGIPALVFTAALGSIVYALLNERIRGRLGAAIRRPWSSAASRAAQEQTRAQRSPS